MRKIFLHFLDFYFHLNYLNHGVLLEKDNPLINLKDGLTSTELVGCLISLNQLTAMIAKIIRKDHKELNIRDLTLRPLRLL
jgi:hypothetical protein